MPDACVIETHQLTKRFGLFAAVEALDLNVRAQQITGFLGRNGAGKSTTIKMILGMTHPTSGTGTLLGNTIDELGPIEVKERRPIHASAPAFSQIASKTVVLPAPFGPMKPTIAPRVTENVTSSTARTPP